MIQELHADQVLRPQGYRVIGFFVEADTYAVAVAGFRVVNLLAWRHGGQLLDWMIDEAKRLHCDQFHLDSSVSSDRTDAHRLYFNKRMRISSFHFSRPL